MGNIKTSFSFNEGVISETENFEFNLPEDIGNISIVEGVKFTLSSIIFQNKLSGKVSVEIINEKLYVTYNVATKEIENILKQELKSTHEVSNSNL